MSTTLSLGGETPDFTSLIIIVCGSEKRMYVVHKDFIFPYSQYVRDNWDPMCQPITSQMLEIPDVEDFDSMQVLVNWCYNKKTQLMKVYYLAVRLQMVHLADDVVDQFRKHSECRLIEPSFVELMVKHREARCGLARFIIDDLACFLAKDPKTWQDLKNSFTKAMKPLIDSEAALLSLVYVAQMRFAAGEAPPKRKPLCFYHDHGEDLSQCAGADDDLAGLDADSGTEDEADFSDSDYGDPRPSDKKRAQQAPNAKDVPDVENDGEEEIPEEEEGGEDEEDEEAEE